MIGLPLPPLIKTRTGIVPDAAVVQQQGTPGTLTVCWMPAIRREGGKGGGAEAVDWGPGVHAKGRAPRQGGQQGGAGGTAADPEVGGGALLLRDVAGGGRGGRFGWAGGTASFPPPRPGVDGPEAARMKRAG